MNRIKRELLNRNMYNLIDNDCFKQYYVDYAGIEYYADFVRVRIYWNVVAIDYILDKHFNRDRKGAAEAEWDQGDHPYDPVSGSQICGKRSFREAMRTHGPVRLRFRRRYGNELPGGNTGSAYDPCCSA